MVYSAHGRNSPMPATESMTCWTAPAICTTPTALAPCGYATPARLAGPSERPGLPTLAIIGDYGFSITVQELGAAVKLGLPLPIILWDNGKFGRDRRQA